MESIKAKRIRRDPDTTRGMILDVTERLMVEEGYASVSSRRIAQEIGLNAATVHYYYPATDDIFIALHRRMTERNLRALETVLAGPRRLEALWKFQSDWDQTALGVEFIALANHRKAIRGELARTTDDARMMHAAAIERGVAYGGIDRSVLPPVALATILVSIARTLANEERVGMTQGHAEVRAFMQWALERIAA